MCLKYTYNTAFTLVIFIGIQQCHWNNVHFNSGLTKVLHTKRHLDDKWWQIVKCPQSIINRFHLLHNILSTRIWLFFRLCMSCLIECAAFLYPLHLILGVHWSFHRAPVRCRNSIVAIKRTIATLSVGHICYDRQSYDWIIVFHVHWNFLWVILFYLIVVHYYRAPISEYIQ